MADNRNRGTRPQDYTKRIATRRDSGRLQPQRGHSRRKKKDRTEQLLWVLIAVVVISCILVVSLGAVWLNKGGEVKPVIEPSGGLAPETMAETVAHLEEPSETVGGSNGGDAPAVQPQPDTQTVSFISNLSEYEKYMNPTGASRDAYLILVNPQNPLASNYVPEGMISVKSTRKDGRKTQQLREYAAKALEALMIEAEAAGVLKTSTPSGYPLSVMSAYRTYEYQGSLFESYVNSEMSSRGISRAEAEAIVVTYSCRAGTSEHQTGLCVDMHTLASANVAFKNEAESAWLLANCHKFGFVLRFPEDKVSVTGIQYEPWHFRYVGRYHATRMKDLGMCLEEYTEYLKNNG